MGNEGRLAGWKEGWRREEKFMTEDRMERVSGSKVSKSGWF